MIKRLPIIPTIIVAAAVALMLGLGIWQLRRAEWKEGLLTQYAEAEKLPPIAFPTGPLRDAQLPLFRYATGVCLRIAGKRAVAGENRAGEPPWWVHLVWIPVATILTIGGLRLAKAWLLAQEYKHRAREGRIAP